MADSIFIGMIVVLLGISYWFIGACDRLRR